MTQTSNTPKATAINPSTGEVVEYDGTREVLCATFARGSRNFTLRFTGRSHVKDWHIVQDPAGEAWHHVGWSAQPPLLAQKAAWGTNPYYAEVMAVLIVEA